MGNVGGNGKPMLVPTMLNVIPNPQLAPLFNWSKVFPKLRLDWRLSMQAAGSSPG
jgi:hypothetical protein